MECLETLWSLPKGTIVDDSFLSQCPYTKRFHSQVHRPMAQNVFGKAWDATTDAFETLTEGETNQIQEERLEKLVRCNKSRCELGNFNDIEEEKELIQKWSPMFLDLCTEEAITAADSDDLESCVIPPGEKVHQKKTDAFKKEKEIRLKLEENGCNYKECKRIPKSSFGSESGDAATGVGT